MCQATPMILMPIRREQSVLTGLGVKSGHFASRLEGGGGEDAAFIVYFLPSHPPFALRRTHLFDGLCVCCLEFA